MLQNPAPVTGTGHVADPPRGVFGYLQFRRAFYSSIIAKTGTSIAPIALAFAVLRAGGGAHALGLVLAANTVPAILFTVLGGVFADRVSRSHIVAVGRIWAAAVQLTVAVLVLRGMVDTSSLAVCGFLVGTSDAFIGPASSAVVCQTVPASALQQANAMMRLPVNVIKIAGPVVGGILVSIWSPGWAMAFAAVCLAVAAVPMFRVRTTPLRTEDSRRSGVLADIAAGWTEFVRRSWLWSYTLSGTVVVAFWLAGFQLLGPTQAEHYYSGSRAWGFIQGSLSVGLVAGTLVSLRWRPQALLRVCLLCSFGMAIPLVCLAVRAPLWLVMAGCVLTGVLLDISIIAWATVMQQHLMGDTLARLTAFNSVGEQAAIPVAYLTVALCAGRIGSTDLLWSSAAMIILATAANLAVPAVHRIRRIV